MDWRYNGIWFEQLPQDKFFKQDLKIDKKLNADFSSAEYAILWHLKSGQNAFDNLPPSDELLYLELNCANATSLQGLAKFPFLKRLEIHYCTKLETDKGISQLKDTLRYLHINQSKKFKFIDELLSLSKLKVLCLNACGPIEELSFLKYFPELIDFRFVDTNILDGNLTPIIEHPTIRTVGFLNKRHYNIKDDQLDKELELKSKDEYKHYAYKGEYRTARYDY